MKHIFITALCAMTLQTALADEVQTEEVERHHVETNSFWSNWFVSLGAGGQIYFGDHDKQCKLGDRIAPALDVAVGKWFSPEIGVRLMYSGLQVKGATQQGALAHSTGHEVPGKGGTGYWLEKQKFNMGNLHLDMMLNFSNLICGYNPNRIWNITPYIGLGYALCYDSPSQKEVSANLGVLSSWKLCPALDLNLDIRSMYVDERFDGEDGGSFGEGLLSVAVGVTYKFKPRGWSQSKRIKVVETIADTLALNRMSRELQQISAENEALKKAVAAGNKREERVIVKNMAVPNLVVFALGKSTLSNEARANIGMLAEVIKKGSPDMVYTITGYADRGTGNTELNQHLSRERAEAVRDCLVKEFGVSEKQVKVDYKGGVENMFYDDPRLSRAVITRGE